MATKRKYIRIRDASIPAPPRTLYRTPFFSGNSQKFKSLLKRGSNNQFSIETLTAVPMSIISDNDINTNNGDDNNTDNNNIHEFDNRNPPTMNINIDERTLTSPPPDLHITPMTSPILENIVLDVEELPVMANIDKIVESKMHEVNILDIIPENEIIKDIENKITKSKKTGKLTQKMKLGKIGKKVSVLINDNTTRKNIRNEKHLLNITPMKKIKEYLKQNSLLEVGSTAPDDVLRSIYTNAKLSGELENKNGDVLLNNFIKEDM